MKHCWHANGNQLINPDASEEIICCHCGDVSVRCREYREHGKSAPIATLPLQAYPQDDCPGDKAEAA